MTIGSFLEKTRVNDFINKYGMLEKGDGIVLGLSGGPDSVCLFLVLMALQQEYGLSICAAHINHMIRGKDADEDEAFVERLCAAYDIPLIVERIDIPALVRESGRSVEEEARMARYQVFDRLAAQLEQELDRPVKIAVAHNADDNAETVLFHMARGCGLDGMCGILPKRGRIIRPLLEVPKQEILELLEENGQDYCIDGTNSDIEYDRNRVRANIIPELRQINPQALRHISAMTENLTEVSEYLELEAKGLLEMARSDGDSIRKRTLLTAPRIIRMQALKLYLSKYMPNEKDVSKIHLEQAEALLTTEGEKYLDLPHKKRLVSSYETMSVVDQKEERPDRDMPTGNFQFREFVLTGQAEYPRNTYTKWFDCDKISGEIVVRNRMEGDYLTINSEGGTKSLKQYFIDEKIPKNMRDTIPLVCDGSHVMWVVGYRISEHYKLTEDTRRVIEVVYTEEQV